MFFGRATSGFAAMFATHPALEDRIKRIDPSWNGEFPENVAPTDATRDAVAASGAAGFAGSSATAPAASAAVASIGRPGPDHLAYAAAILRAMPDNLQSAAREPFGARAVIYALLLDSRPAMRERQTAHLAAAADPEVFREMQRVWPMVEALDARARLPLLEIALPALRSLTATQRERFEGNVTVLMETDNQIDLFEWSVRMILQRDLDALRTHDAGSRVKYHAIADVKPEITLLLSALAQIGHDDAVSAAQAYAQAKERLGLGDRVSASALTLDALDRSVTKLDLAAPDVKRQVLEAAVACITADRQVTAAEAEVLRAVSAAMSCPMPPLLA